MVGEMGLEQTFTIRHLQKKPNGGAQSSITSNSSMAMTHTYKNGQLRHSNHHGVADQNKQSLPVLNKKLEADDTKARGGFIPCGEVESMRISTLKGANTSSPS